MIEAVGTYASFSSPVRSGAQSSAANIPAPKIEQAPGYLLTSIRVDNLQNVAILEIRSREGEVVNQYPTEGQIRAIKRAAELEQRKLAEATDGIREAPQQAPVETDVPEVSYASTESSVQVADISSVQFTAPAPSAPAPQLSGEGNSILV